ncbi:MAG TPA: histidine phosphatase family protein [Mycobacteriales bacterium]
MAKRTLYLVRHGQYRRNARRPSGESDGELTGTGHQQAALVGLRLRDIPVDVIHHSTLVRARQTAEVIAVEFPGVPLRPSGLLRECIPGMPEVIPEAFREFFATASRNAIVDGSRQAAEALATLFRDDPGPVDRHEVVVTHGNLISHLAAQALGAPSGSWIRADIHHCGITEVCMGTRRGLTLVCHNDTGHLTQELRTNG